VAVVQLNSFGCGLDAFTQQAIRDLLAARGKTHTVLRIDELTSPGSARLRLRSLVETMDRPRPPRQAPTPRPPRLFEAEDRTKTILIPSFSRFCAPVIAGPFRALGYDVRTLPATDRESLAIGLRYAPHDVCYPAIAVVGDVVKALQSGDWDPAHVVIGSWQTGGQCRASNYLSLLQQALRATGFAEVPIVALTPNRRLHPQPGYNLNLRRWLPKALLAAIYGDAVAALYHAVAARSDDRRAAAELAAELLAPLGEGKMELTRPAVMARLAVAVDAFNALPADDRPRPAVGLVGEIYVKHNSFANHDVAHWLMDRGLEPIAPQFLPLFLSALVNTDVRARAHLARRGLAWWAARALENPVRRVWQEAETLLRRCRFHRPRHDVRAVAREAAQVVNLTHAYGECWLTVGEIGLLAGDGVRHVLCLQPFGCLASQVVAQGVERRLRRHYPQTTVTYLDVDVGGSAANWLNRLELLASQALDQPVASAGRIGGTPKPRVRYDAASGAPQ
jgi:predicted nucleotide-binding protein (sugar kinase/HSP70/actin superfamily)